MESSEILPIAIGVASVLGVIWGIRITVQHFMLKEYPSLFFKVYDRPYGFSYEIGSLTHTLPKIVSLKFNYKIKDRIYTTSIVDNDFKDNIKNTEDKYLLGAISDNYPEIFNISQDLLGDLNYVYKSKNDSEKIKVRWDVMLSYNIPLRGKKKFLKSSYLYNLIFTFKKDNYSVMSKKKLSICPYCILVRIYKKNKNNNFARLKSTSAGPKKGILL